MIYDYLLVGHGLAGAILAQVLAARGHSLLVLDEPKANSASNIAAGLINPIAGKRFAKSWRAEVLVPFATQFYQQLEHQTGTRFFYPKPILKLFSSVEEQNNWMGKSAGTDYGDFINQVFTSLPASESIKQEQGGLLIAKGGYVEVPVLLEVLGRRRVAQAQLRAEYFDPEELLITADYVQYKDLQARQIIFCEGYRATQNPYFNWLPFALNKGEVLTIKSAADISENYIYNKAVYVLPKNTQCLRVGATYNWRSVDEEPTEAGKTELCAKIADILKLPFTVSEHTAGIRPAVRDRRPLIGTHPEYSRIKIFNGMGSKGVMMAPYLAAHYVQVLNGAEELLSEVNISRYITLYKEHLQPQ